MTHATIVSINVNPHGGVPKIAVSAAVLGTNGVAGDKQRNLRFHGGPTRAVCLYSLEQITALQDEGHPIEPGTTGENLTISGLDWNALSIGTQLRVGAAVIEITAYAAPCSNIAGSFVDGAFTRISQKTSPGWSRVYASVIVSAEVRVGDVVTLVAPAVAAETATTATTGS